MIRPSNSLVGTQLNSVWLEGILVADPVDLTSAPLSCWFHVETPLPVIPDPPSVFLIEASESALEGCRPRLGKGQQVRIIGRLHQHRWRDASGFLREEVSIISEMVDPTGVRA